MELAAAGAPVGTFWVGLTGTAAGTAQSYGRLISVRTVCRTTGGHGGDQASTSAVTQLTRDFRHRSYATSGAR
jgi:hypothetical protein